MRGERKYRICFLLKLITAKEIGAKKQRQQKNYTMPAFLRMSLEDTEETCQSATEVLMKGSTRIRTLNPG